MKKYFARIRITENGETWEESELVDINYQIEDVVGYIKIHYGENFNRSVDVLNLSVLSEFKY